jgi:aldehyde:ferredoxin oxidoreductase
VSETIPGGYNGKLLRVNLSDNTTTTEDIDELLCRRYLGGAGFISYFLWKELAQGVDPLGPGNKLIFALGPVTGIQLPGNGRNCIGAKSPLTGGIAKSEVGGFWGAELKRAGFDTVIVEGKAERPVYLWIYDGKAEIKDASHLWGKKTKEAQELLRNELGDNKVQIALIGPGGENLVRYACIMNGLNDAAGRGGLGAVMGSKNLKAVCVRGRKAPALSNADGVKGLREWMLANMNMSPVGGLHDCGTGGGFMERGVLNGNLPVRNFRDGLFKNAINLDATTIKDTILVGMEGCFACPVRCKKVVQVDEPYPVDPAYGGPEYETLAALGSNCGIADLKATAKGSELCNAYSLDTISTGVTIGFAMECFENGLLTREDTCGIEVKFGNTEAMLQLIELIAKREGFGNLLAEGSARVARSIGEEANKYLAHVKGLEMAMHEPRLKPGLGLGYMVNPHGADHCCNMQDTAYAAEPGIKKLQPLGILEPVPQDDMGPRKVGLFKLIQCKEILNDCMVMCLFLPYSILQVTDLISAVTGWSTSPTELLTIAERVLTTARLFNVREGLTSADDTLPERFFQPKTDGYLADKCLNHDIAERAKNYYYALMEWDVSTGIPLHERVEELRINQ